MNINQLTATIKHKQIQLDQQISQLQQQLNTAEEPATARLTQELSALQGLRHTLLKSHEIALSAHALQTQHSPHNPHNHRRFIGLVLCSISGLGLLALAIIALLL